MRPFDIELVPSAPIAHDSARWVPTRRIRTSAILWPRNCNADLGNDSETSGVLALSAFFVARALMMREKLRVAGTRVTSSAPPAVLLPRGASDAVRSC